jgi:hypothetical protein
VKDLLFRKAFPEQGLVFRNEQDVLRNRKLARALMYGSAAVGALLLVLLVVSSIQFGKLIGGPRDDATRAPGLVDKPVEALTLVGRLDGDVKVLKGSVWPSILSLGIGADRPVQYLTRIQMALFEHSVLHPLLAETDRSLPKARVAPVADAQGAVPFDQYRGALEEYVGWYGCAGEGTLPGSIDYASFEKLCAVIPKQAPVLATQRQDVFDQAKRYFATIRGVKDWSNPSRFLSGKRFDPPRTIRAGIVKLHEYGEHYAVLSEEHPDPVIREWMRLRNRCAQINDAYQAMLAATEAPVQTQEQLDKFRQTFEEIRQRESPPKKKERAMCADDADRGAGKARAGDTVRSGVPGTRCAVLQPHEVEKPPGRWESDGRQARTREGRSPQRRGTPRGDPATRSWRKAYPGQHGTVRQTPQGNLTARPSYPGGGRPP